MTRCERFLLSFLAVFFFGRFFIETHVHAQQTPIGAVRTTPSMGSGTTYTTDYNSGIFVPAQTTDTTPNKTLTGTPRLVTVLVFATTSSTATTVTVGDGTSNLWTGVTIAANSTTVVTVPGGLVLGKVVMSQSVTGGVNAYIGGYK